MNMTLYWKVFRLLVLTAATLCVCLAKRTITLPQAAACSNCISQTDCQYQTGQDGYSSCTVDVDGCHASDLVCYSS